MPMYCHHISISYFEQNIFKRKNKCITMSDKNDTTLYHETANLKILYIQPLLIRVQGSGAEVGDREVGGRSCRACLAADEFIFLIYFI